MRLTVAPEKSSRANLRTHGGALVRAPAPAAPVTRPSSAAAQAEGPLLPLSPFPTLSALTLLVQASPVHNTKSLESLRTMAERGRGKGGRDEGLKAMRCVVDWWIGGGAPGRKLKCVHTVA